MEKARLEHIQRLKQTTLKLNKNPNEQLKIFSSFTSCLLRTTKLEVLELRLAKQLYTIQCIGHNEYVFIEYVFRLLNQQQNGFEF